MNIWWIICQLTPLLTQLLTAASICSVCFETWEFIAVKKNWRIESLFIKTHQILTCVSVSRRDAARPARSEELRYLNERRKIIALSFHAPVNLFKQSLIYLFISNVDSSWKTWARENTVRVFFLRLFWEFGEALSVFRPSVLSSSSSSMISCSSSDSLASFGRYVWCDCGDFEGADGGGVKDGERFSVLFVELSAWSRRKKKRKISHYKQLCSTWFFLRVLGSSYF